MKTESLTYQSVVLFFLFTCVLCLGPQSSTSLPETQIDESNQSSPILLDVNENYVCSDFGPFNVSGVRIFNFYPLDLTSDLFCKIGPYSDATFGTAFASVLGFNGTRKSQFLDALDTSPLIVSSSIVDDIHNNCIHFGFADRPTMEFLLFPYLLISTEELCNSTTWIESDELYQRRWNSVGISDSLMQQFPMYFYPERREWGRPCSYQSFPIITSVEDIEPSIHLLYELGNDTIPIYPYDCLLFCPSSTPSGGIIEFQLAWDYGIEEMPHLSIRARHLKYYDIAVVSFNDNPHASGPPYQNQAFPSGQVSVQTNFLWHIEALLRYAVNHAIDLKSRITMEFPVIDATIDLLESGQSIAELELILELLSEDMGSKLTEYQNEIFDIQDLILHCTRIANDFRNTTYIEPFELYFQELVQLIQEESGRAESRHLGLKANLDNAVNLARQSLANAQFQMNIDVSFRTLWLSIGVAIMLQLISLGYKIWNDRRNWSRDKRMSSIRISEALCKSIKAPQLRAILQRHNLDTKGTKLTLALRLVKEKGIEAAEQILEEQAH